jgi:hydrogenase-4 component F
LHALLALWLLVNPPVLAANVWFGFDPLARAVLPMVSLLFLVCSIYAVAYLQIRAERKNRIFVIALLVMLGLLSLALQAQNLGLLWVAAEATTLVTVPLLHFTGTARAFEASWKYLLVGGTGIALSLLGSFCLGYASLHGGGNGDLTFSAVTAQKWVSRQCILGSPMPTVKRRESSARCSRAARRRWHSSPFCA